MVDDASRAIFNMWSNLCWRISVNVRLPNRILSKQKRTIPISCYEHVAMLALACSSQNFFYKWRQVAFVRTHKRIDIDTYGSDMWKRLLFKMFVSQGCCKVPRGHCLSSVSHFIYLLDTFAKTQNVYTYRFVDLCMAVFLKKILFLQYWLLINKNFLNISVNCALFSFRTFPREGTKRINATERVWMICFPAIAGELCCRRAIKCGK